LTTATAEPATRTPRWSERRPGPAAAAYAGGYLVLAFGAAGLAPRMPSAAALAILATAAGVATLALSLLLVLSLCRLRLAPRAEFAWMLAMGLLFCLARPSVLVIIGRWLGGPEPAARVAAVLSLALGSHGQHLLGNAALIMWAVFLGRLVARVIREGKLILPVAVVASVADVITVYWGLVARVAETAPEVVEAFSAAAPVAPPPEVPAPVLTAIGIGDFLFLAMFLAVTLRHAMRPAASLWATFGLLLLAPAAFLLWPDLPGLPGLPFISAAVLAANWRHLAFTGSEKRALVVAGVLVAAVVLAVVVLLAR